MGIAAFILVGAGEGAAHAHAARPRIAVLGVTAEQLRAEVRNKISAAVAGGLAASGADVVDSETTAKGAAAKGIAGCETPTCRVAIADATGARYLVRGSVETVGRSYTVRLEMIDGTSGAVIGVREDRCEICTESEAYDTASVTASVLKAEVVKRSGGANDESTVGHKVAAADLADPATKGATKGATAAPTMVSAGGSGAASGDANPPRLRGWSWATLGVGVAAIASGIFLVSIDGEETCKHPSSGPCPNVYTTRSGGFGLISGGVLAAVLGTTLLIGRF